jgi:GAF domain-containing protein/ActR/RegA family two-component response regulator
MRPKNEPGEVDQPMLTPEETGSASKSRDRKSRSSGTSKSARIQGLFEDLMREPTVPEYEPSKVSPEIFQDIPPSTPVDASPIPGLPEGATVQQPSMQPPPETMLETAPPSVPLAHPTGQGPSKPGLPPLSPEGPLALPLIDHGSAAVRLTSRDVAPGAMEQEQLLPAVQPITPHPYESLRTGRPVVESAQPGQPAVLAYGRVLPPTGTGSLQQADNTPALLLEVLDEDPQRIWSEDEVLLVEQVTDQLSLALENARLFQEARLRAEQLAKLNEIGLGLTSTLDPKPLLQLIMQSAVDILNCEAGSLFLLDAETNELVFEVVLGPVASDLVGRRLPPGTGLAGQSAQTGKPIIANNVRSRKDWSAQTDGQTGFSTECLMVAPMRIKDHTVGVIEVINKNSGAPFNQADQELLAAFTTQATIAIENARLYTEEMRRRQIADALSGIARTISSALDVHRIAEQTLEQLTGLIAYRFASIQLLQDGRRETIATMADEPVMVVYPETLMSQVLDDRRERLILDAAVEPEANELYRRGIRSWIAAPLLAGDEVLGLIAAGHDQPQAFRREDLEFIRPVAAQIAVAIQNARLFEQTQTARDALQISVRYQRSVAQSVAALTERGSAALTEVLEQLGQSAQASRAYYFETQVDSRGPYWRLIAEWRAPEVPSQLGNPLLRRLPAKTIEKWIERLRTQGFNIATARGAQGDEGDYFAATGTRTALQFAVAGRLGLVTGLTAEIPGCIGFDQIDSERAWTTEEIAALQTAASALSNTYAREDLFAQVQANLAETEAQYQASARFNSASSYNDILQVLRQHTVLGNANATDVSLNLFDRAWKQAEVGPDDRPDWLMPIARWSVHTESMLSIPANQPARYPIGKHTGVKQLLHPERPTVVMDIANDPRIDESSRHLFLEQMNARSLLYMPLNVSGRWIGHIIAIYRQLTVFGEHELRRLTSLAGQAAVAIEGLRLVEETRQRNEELATINQITSAVSRTLDPGEVLSEILVRVLSAIDYESGLISLLEPHSDRLRLSVHQNLPEALVLRLTEQGMEGTSCDLVFRSGELIYQPDLDAISVDLDNTRIDPDQLVASLQGPLGLGFHSYLGVPLVSKGVTLGTICLFNRQAKTVTPTRLSLLSSVGQQLGVVVENARLFQESQRRARQLQAAAEIARDTTSTLALDALLQRAVSLLCDRFGYYHASIYLLDETGKEAVVRGSSGIASGELMPALDVQTASTLDDYRLPVGGQSVVGRVTATGQPVLINDVKSEQGQSIHQPNPLLPQTRTELGLPLKIGDRVIGALEVQSSQPNAITEDDIAVLQTLTDQIAVAVDNARSYELAQKAVEEISEADRLKTQFLANMSHELRTPLNSIIGFSRVILKGIDGPVTEQQTQDLTAIYNSGQHLLGLINDVLDLSKIEAGKMEMALEENVNLADIIRSVMSTTIGLVKDKKIELKQNLSPDLPLLTIDPMKIRQVLINLLSNAAKFTDKGSITVEAEPYSKINGHVSSIIVRVIDTGAGIAPKDQAKLFQPFSQVDGSLTRKSGGSGLGLSICQHLVRMHGGEIGLDSDVGKGSVFYFILPTKPAAAQESAAQLASENTAMAQGEPEPELVYVPSEPVLKPPPNHAQSAPAGNPDQTRLESAPALVLVIDKDPQLTDIYRRYLAGQDFTVVALTELEQALTVARGIQPYAITLDVTMPAPASAPGLDGWKVLETFKTNPDTQAIPVIVCTMVAEQERASRLGAAEYLLKPILEEELIDALKRVRR